MILTIDEAATFAGEAQARGQRVVLTNGVFDLLHPGHVRFLQTARARGDVLIVAVNSDRSVRAAKGPTRPVVPERERAEIIAALRAVDAAVIVDDEMTQAVVDRLKPDVVVTAADVPVEQGWSSSAIIKKAQSVPGR